MASKWSNDWPDYSEFAPFIESLSGPPQPLSLFSVQCPQSSVLCLLAIAIALAHWGCSSNWTCGGLVSETLASVRCPPHLAQKVTLGKNSIWVHRAYALAEAETPDFVPRVVPVKHYVFVSGLPFSWIYYNQNKVRGLHWNYFIKGVGQLFLIN